MKDSIQDTLCHINYTSLTPNIGNTLPLNKLVLKFEHSILLSNDMSETAGSVANSVDPDQMQSEAKFNLGLHCLLRLVCPST